MGVTFKSILLIYFISVTCLGLVYGQQLESFSLEDLEGDWQTLEDLKGEKATVVDFWATWCKPCVKAMPKLDELYENLSDKGLGVIGISCDGPRSVGKINPVINSMAINYPILKDIDCEVMNAHEFQAFPTLVLLDADGKITWVHEGFKSGDEHEIEKQVMELLK